MNLPVVARMLNEADTCRKYVVPRLQAAGWDTDPHSIAEQRSFTDGRIIPHGSSAKRRPDKQVDHCLRSMRKSARSSRREATR